MWATWQSKGNESLEFPGGPGVRTPQFRCWGPRFHSWSWRWDPSSQSAQPKNKPHKIKARTEESFQTNRLFFAHDSLPGHSPSLVGVERRTVSAGILQMPLLGPGFSGLLLKPTGLIKKGLVPQKASLSVQLKTDDFLKSLHQYLLCLTVVWVQPMTLEPKRRKRNKKRRKRKAARQIQPRISLWR